MYSTYPIEKLIKRATGVLVNGKAIWDEINQVAGGVNPEDDGDLWITGQDDCMERWEYYVTIKHDAETDENGDLIESWTDIVLKEIKIEPRSKNSKFYNGKNLNEPYYIKCQNVEVDL